MRVQEAEQEREETKNASCPAWAGLASTADVQNAPLIRGV